MSIGGWRVGPTGKEHMHASTCKGVDPDTKVGGGDGLVCNPTFSSWGSGGAVRPPTGSGAEPRRQTHFSKIFCKLT